MTGKKQGLLKDGTRRRNAGRGGGMPRIMWLAILVCIVGAVFLFRTQSADVPAGIGEQQTVVTAPDVESNLSDAPIHSGDVDIAGESTTLVPEEGAGQKPTAAAAAADTPVPTPDTTPPAPATTTPAATATPATTPTQKPSAQVVPLELGPYVVQVGSFGNADNADREAERLQAKGWDARVKVGNTSDGTIIYRVRIGYFPSRADAETFIKQNRSLMPGAIAQHR